MGGGGVCGKRNFTLHNCGTSHSLVPTFPPVSKASCCWIYWIVFGKIESAELTVLYRRNYKLISYFEKQDVFCIVKGVAKIFEAHEFGWG